MKRRALLAVAVSLVACLSVSTAGAAPAPAQLGASASPPHASAALQPAFVVTAESSTTSASVLLTVSGVQALTTVQVRGGALPVAEQADEAGTANVVVPLRSGAQHRLSVEAVVGSALRQRVVPVRQVAAPGTGSIRGRVMSAEDGRALPHATVQFGAVRTTTDSSGAYELQRVPAGHVVATVNLKGRVTGLVTAHVGATTSVQTTATKLPLLGAPRKVGPRGATVAGSGWRVVIPPGALARSALVSIRPIEQTGAVDEVGLPVLEVMPSQLRFTKPVDVKLDRKLVKASATVRNPDLRLSLLDLASLEQTPLRVRPAASGELLLQVSAGGQIRTQPAPPQLQDEAQCKPFTDMVQAATASRTASRSVSAWGLRFRAAKVLFDAYLTPGAFSATRRVVSDESVREEFRTSPTTQAAVSGLMQRLTAHVSSAPPPLRSPASPYRNDLEPTGLGQRLKINWQGFNTPGLIAGSTGKLVRPWPAGAVYGDDRTIDGFYEVVPTATPTGVLSGVSLRGRGLELLVLDAVDFCPGGLGGLSGVLIGRTLDMSRLEQTPYPGGGGKTWAKPILWRLTTDLAPQSVDISELYPGNDPDADRIPDRQPWEGASFRLDNCPGTANPGQEDSNGDGVGDACDLELRYILTLGVDVSTAMGSPYSSVHQARYVLVGRTPIQVGPPGLITFSEARGRSSLRNATNLRDVCRLDEENGDTPPYKSCDVESTLTGTSNGTLTLNSVVDSPSTPLTVAATVAGLAEHGVTTCTGSCGFTSRAYVSRTAMDVLGAFGRGGFPGDPVRFDLTGWTTVRDDQGRLRSASLDVHHPMVNPGYTLTAEWRIAHREPAV